MDLRRYVARVALAAAVITIGVWATKNQYIVVPPYEFWLGIVSYLIAAEVVWTLAERKSGGANNALPRRGLYWLNRLTSYSLPWPRWFHQGGRVRPGDILARHDSQREALMAIQTAVANRVAGLRVHLLKAPLGSGRSTFLYRLGRSLAEAGHPVYLVSPTPELLASDRVLDAARRRQVYLLVDDIDLRPEAEEWLYELERAALPVVVIATSAPAEDHTVQPDWLDALRPADLVGRAVHHDISVAHHDMVTLSRRLATDGQAQRVGLSLQEADNLLYATRAFQGRDAETGLWRDLDRGPALAVEGKLMIALVGTAEMCFTGPVWTALFGERSPGRWQKAALVVADHGLILPPHTLTCLDLLEQTGNAAVAGALNKLCRTALALEPAFVARLLCGLARSPQTRDLARAQLEALELPTPPLDWPEAVQRLWHRAQDALGIAPPSQAKAASYPPETNLRLHACFTRGDYPQALALARELSHDPIYQCAARFDAALALAHLGQLSEAETELATIRESVPGVHYLRGVLAELRGDIMRALDCYEASRKADDLLISSTRRLAFASVKSGAPRAAIPLFEALLAHAPLDADLYAGLAVAHLHAGMAQRAAAQSARAIQAGVDPIEARKAVARACAGVQAYARAAAELEACLSYDPNDLEAWRELVVACQWLGRFAREEEGLRRLHEHDPADDEVRLQMARCQRDQGHTRDALEALRPMLALENADLRAVLLAAELAAAASDPAGQEALARRALQQGDESGWGWYWLADSQSEMNDEAQAAYESAIRLMRRQIRDGMSPRHTATLWQGICLAATALGDTELAAQAARKATQEAAICDAIGAEIHSVAHCRAVPGDLFVDSVTPHPNGGLGAPAVASDPLPRLTSKQVPAPGEAPVLRDRRLRGGG